MRASYRRNIVRVHKVFFSILNIVGISVATTTVMVFATTLNVQKIAPFFLPTLAAFFGFSALLYNRARAYPAGAIQRRSLYVANLSLNAAILYLIALILGAVVSFAIYVERPDVKPRDFSFSDPEIFNALVFYWLPVLFVSLSYTSFSVALRLFFIEMVLPRRLRADLRRMNK